MVDFNTFMSVYLTKCGAGEASFAAGVEVWNNEKQAIKAMSEAEVRSKLSCA